MLTIKKLFFFLVIICIGILMVSCSPKEEITSTEEVDLSNELKIIEAFGLIKAEESKDVIIDFPAVVQEILVKEGQHIRLHDPILTLDLSQYQLQILDKKNELNIANLEYQQSNKVLQGISLENKDIVINKLTNDLNFSKKLYEQLVEELQSKEKLYEEGAISEETLVKFKRIVDEAEMNIDVIEYELQLAISENKRNVEKYILNKDTEKDQVNIQSERILQIKTNLSAIEDKTNKSYIIGSQIVSEYENAAIHDISYSTGNIVDTTQKAFSIVNLDSLIVEANVVEEFIKDVQEGASVKIVPIADRTREYEGSVIYISQMAFPNNGETVVPVRISIDDMDSFLLPNFNVDVYIEVQ